jgi:Flp pilus assembly protein TadD
LASVLSPPPAQKVDEIYNVAWSRVGKHLAAVSFHHVHIWNPETGVCTAVLDGANDQNHVLAWNPKEPLLAYRGAGKSIVVWNAKSGAAERELRGRANPSCVAWSPDGRRIAAGYPDGHLTFWDLGTGQEAFAQLRVHDGEIRDLSWSADGGYLATACADGSVGVLGTPPADQRGAALAESNLRLAWSLAANPEARLRNPARAVDLAQRLLKASGAEERRWVLSALGAAQLRAGNARGAVDALEEVLRLGGDDGHAAYFLALAHAELGDPEQAKKRFGEATRWMDRNRPWDEPLLLVRAEAAALLKLKDEPQQAPPYFAQRQYTTQLRFIITWENPEERIAQGRAAVRKWPDNADTLNFLAWLLVTCPDPKFQDAPEAIRLAKRALQLAPHRAYVWNTLGVAHYRAREWADAIKALTQSMDVSGGGGADWFFLAMSHWQLGDKKEAERWYHQAAQWMEKYKPDDPEYRRFRTEAANLLGLKAPSP